MPVLISALQDHEPLIRGHAAWALGQIGSEGAVWALGQIGSEGAVQALRGRAGVEEDGWVREEISIAFEPRDGA